MMIRFIFLISLVFLTAGCHKSFLSERPDMARIVPQSIADLQAMMDNVVMMNESSKILATIGADEYYYTDDEWKNVSNPTFRNGYLWEKEVFDGEESNDWNYAYRKVLYCNMVLERLAEITPNIQDQESYDIVKGTALFHRSMAFYDLLQLFAYPYIPNGDNDRLGIVLKLTSDIAHNPGRSSIENCYARLLQDLAESVNLLPDVVAHKNRPTRFASMALLCRVHLNMGNYIGAARLCAEIMDHFPLIDYTTYQRVGTNSFPSDANDNPEIIFRSMIRYAVSQLNYSLSDDLLSLFGQDDHRSRLFLRINRNKPVFAGSYYGSTTSFSGLAIDEVYLIAVECNIHLGSLEKARQILMYFQKNRYDIPDENIDDDGLFTALFEERRKQLMLRGLRWEDLRRLNFVLGKNIRVQRPVIEDVAAVLEGQSARYIWPIPDSAIELGGLIQNHR